MKIPAGFRREFLIETKPVHDAPFGRGRSGKAKSAVICCVLVQKPNPPCFRRRGDDSKSNICGLIFPATVGKLYKGQQRCVRTDQV